jgi:hypothetical protein
LDKLGNKGGEERGKVAAGIEEREGNAERKRKRERERKW